jgi:hypothetical protein
MAQVTETEPAAPPEEPVLTPQVSAVWALRLVQLPVVAILGLVFLLSNFMPLRPTDLWGHVAWGDWILQHGQLPAQDPTFALAEGMPVVDSAWLSQVIFAAIDRYAGPAWLSNAFALVTLATWLIIWRVLYLRAGNWLTSFAMLLVVFAVSFSRLTTIRPENFAWLCFAILWWLLTPPRAAKTLETADEPEAAPAASGFRWQLWIGVPLVMVLWANLHGSFVCGLAVLAASAAGAAISTLARTRSLAATFRSAEVQQSVTVAELGLLATLLNPYGIDLLISTVAFAGNSNLRDVLEWQPFVFGGPGSYEFIASWILAMVLLRYSRRGISLANVLALALFAGLTLAGNRMVGWFALTFGVVFMPLLDDLLGRFAWVRAVTAPPAEDEEVSRGFPLVARSWSYSLIALLLIWISFSLSPTSAPVLGAKPRKPAQLYGPDTPLKLTSFLQKNAIAGPVFCPQWWGDWLHRQSPAVQPFMTSNMHLAPRQVWGDYQRVNSLQAGWGSILARYAIEQIVVDKQAQPDLDRALRRDTAWQPQYDDERAALFVLRKPVPQNRTPTPTPSPPTAKPAQVEAKPNAKPAAPAAD